jgi:Uma2 family endonuclease
MTTAKHWTPEEYVAFERASEERHEYRNGRIVKMEHSSMRHALISTGALVTFHEAADSCFVLGRDMRMKVIESGLYTYADGYVVCDEPTTEDDEQDTLLNPTVIAEVLSSSTESYDRGKKFEHYMTIESLQEYVLISQDAPRIERYYRQNGSEWLYTSVSGLDGILELPSIGCTLALADIYRQVRFDDNETRDA